MAACEVLDPLPAEVAHGRLCAICQTAMGLEESVGACPRCRSPYHAECWAENGGCAAYGCPLAPQTVKDEAPLVPQTFWGTEEKDCPVCGRQVKVAALRCRFCGELFAEREPEGRLAKRRGPAPRTGAAVWLFVGGVIPLTAPFALGLGLVWLLFYRQSFASLPTTHRVLGWLGLCSGALTLSLLLLMGVLYWMLS